MRVIRLAGTLTLTLGLLLGAAMPAGASGSGAFRTLARVGKTASFCNHDGSSDVAGAGMGLPVVHGTKQLFWSIDTRDRIVIHRPPAPPVDTGPGSITVINNAGKPGPGASTGTLLACGQLAPVGKAPVQAGAACVLSKGYNGKGRIYFDAGTPKVAAGVPIYSLHNITWKVTAIGTFPFWASGKAGTIAKGQKGTDLVSGIFTVVGGGDCGTKTGSGASKANGARGFELTGSFTILNGQWSDPNTTPVICKRTADPMCEWNDKKPQTPKQS